MAEAQKTTLIGITRIGIKAFYVRMRDDQVDAFRVKAKASCRVER